MAYYTPPLISYLHFPADRSQTLVQSSACTGLIHESFDRNSFSSFTRPWFAWVNSYFGDLVLKLVAEKPHLVLKKGNAGV